MATIEQLLEPISVEAPCGEDMQFAPELDAIAKARESDDPSLEQGAWVTTVKEADWKYVATQCDKLIATRSKDLKLAVWLAEARTRTAGLRGLGEGMQLIAGLCRRYWDTVYPLAEDGDQDMRIGKLRWLASCMPNLLRETALTEGAGYSMIDFEAARTRPADGETGPDVDGARKRTSRGFYQTLLLDAAFCKEAIVDAESAIDECLGADGPSFSSARSTLEDLIHAVTLSAQEVGAVGASMSSVDAGAVAPAAEQGGALAVLPAGPAQAAGPAQTRTQALAQLREVAAFFRRTEPHSPVAYLAEKAAHWGEQPLHVWLRAVVKDQGICGQLDELLGVEDAS
jgi:type VI secretion system protein ImpA